MSSSSLSAPSRRDFLNGAALGLTALAGGLGCGLATEASASVGAGLQGQTDALSAAAHAGRDDPAHWRHQPAAADPDVEDLVVVGAGLSGLAAAYLYREHAGRPVRILLLDALDEPGGHARHNEFVSRSGQRLIGYGGSQSLDTPSLFSPAARGLLDAVGIDLPRFKNEFYDHSWAARHGLKRRGLYFGADAWGRERFVSRGEHEAPAQWLRRTPLSVRAQADMVRLLGKPKDVLFGMPVQERHAYLSGLTYADFLSRHWRVDAAVLRYYGGETLGYFGVGIEATSALDAYAAGAPGFDGLQLGRQVDPRMSPSGRQLMAGQDAYVYHFADGNAGVARALLRALIPGAVGGEGMTTLADAQLDLETLDRPEHDVRLRLRSTAVDVRHLGDPATAEEAEIRYVDGGGRVRTVRARHVVLACWHRVTARLSSELSAAQIDALNDQVKVPLLYATVLLSNWRAWQRAGVSSIKAVDGFWGEASLDFPVRLGGAHPSPAPDQPILVHLDKVVVPRNGLSPREQASLGRHQLLGWSYEFLEGQVQALLQGALGRHGFRAERDIEAVTINRWSHGYAYEYMRPWDAYWPDGPLPCELARRRWGRVAIANSDAGAYAYAHSAIDQATRAVKDLLPQAALPAWSPMPGPAPKDVGLA